MGIWYGIEWHIVCSMEYPVILWDILTIHKPFYDEMGFSEVVGEPHGTQSCFNTKSCSKDVDIFIFL